MATQQRPCGGLALNTAKDEVIFCSEIITSPNPRCTYHSQTCQSMTHWLHKRGFTEPGPYVILRTCQQCGTRFKLRPSEWKCNYCSKECKRISLLRENQSLEKVEMRRAWDRERHRRDRLKRNASSLKYARRRSAAMRELAEAERRSSELQIQLKDQESLVQQLKTRKVGRTRKGPPNPEQLVPRVRELQSAGWTNKQVQRRMNLESGCSMSADYWRKLAPRAHDSA